MLISSFTLQNGTLFTLLQLFYLQLGLVCTKTNRFVGYSPRKCFNSFVQSAVDARRQSDENPNTNVVAETMKFLANSSYGYQNIDRSGHTVTKYLSDEKTHAANNSKLFKQLEHVNNFCMKLNSPKHRLKTENQSLWVSLIFNRQNGENWSFTATSSANCAT